MSEKEKNKELEKEKEREFITEKLRFGEKMDMRVNWKEIMGEKERKKGGSKEEFEIGAIVKEWEKEKNKRNSYCVINAEKDEKLKKEREWMNGQEMKKGKLKLNWLSERGWREKELSKEEDRREEKKSRREENRRETRRVN